VLNKLYNINIF